MKRTLTLLSLTLVFQVATAAEPKAWYQEGFVKNALQGRAAHMIDDTGFDREINWHRCGAIGQAQFKHSELFVERNDEVNCYEDKDCGIGSLGGFCAVAAHKSQLEGYQLYVKSPTYNYLAKSWRQEKCRGPVGLCLPVDSAYCEKKEENGVGVCRGKWSNEATDEPIFMRDRIAAAADEAKPEDR